MRSLVEVMRIRLISSVVSLVAMIEVCVMFTEVPAHGIARVSSITSSMSVGSMSVGRVSLVIHWLRTWVRTRICARDLIISTSRHTARQPSSYRRRRYSWIGMRRTLSMISDSLQIIHFHLFMLNMMILYPPCLRLSPSRHWRELIFIHMHRRRLTRLLKRGGSRAAIGRRRSSGQRRCCGNRLSVPKIHRFWRWRLLIVWLLLRGVRILVSSAIVSRAAAVATTVAAAATAFAALVTAAEAAN
jgi:hypothetical protein